MGLFGDILKQSVKNGIEKYNSPAEKAKRKKADAARKRKRKAEDKKRLYKHYRDLGYDAKRAKRNVDRWF